MKNFTDENNLMLAEIKSDPQKIDNQWQKIDFNTPIPLINIDYHINKSLSRKFIFDRINSYLLLDQ